MRLPARRVLAGIAVLALLGLATASAATLGVTTKKIVISSATSVPVTDPPVSTCTIRNDYEAYVNQNQGNLEASVSWGVRSATDDNNRGFVHVDLAGSCEESGRPIPSGSGVVSAAMYVYGHDWPSSSRTYDLHRVTATWAEGTITWANQPAVAGTATASVATGTSDGVWKSWTVTEDVQAFFAGTYTNYGWRVADSAENSGTAYDSWMCAHNGGAWWAFCTMSSPDERPYLVLTYQPAEDVCTLRSSADSYVADSYDGNLNDDVWPFTINYLRVDSSGNLLWWDDNERTLLSFNLSGVCSETGEAIPSGSSVSGASLDLYMYDAQGNSTRWYDAHRITGSWTETGVKWSNQPAIAGAATASLQPGASTGVWLSWDVTSDVSGFLGGTYTNYGWLMRDRAEDNASNVYGAFCRREGGPGSCETSGSGDTRPRLVVTYDRPFTETCTLLPTDDTYVNKGSTGTNFDANGYLSVYGYEWLIHSERRTYLKFSVGSSTSGNCSETGAPIPAGATIYGATVKLHTFNPPGGTRNQELYRVTGPGSDTLPWAEGTLTWAGQDTYAVGLADSTSIGTADDTWYEWDATSDAAAFWSGSATNHGWQLRWDDEATNYDMHYCGKSGGDASCDTSGGAGDERPKLVLVYQRP